MGRRKGEKKEGNWLLKEHALGITVFSMQKQDSSTSLFILPVASPSYTLPVSLVHVCTGAQRTKVNIRYEQCVTLQLPRRDFNFFSLFKKISFSLLNILGEEQGWRTGGKGWGNE